MILPKIVSLDKVKNPLHLIDLPIPTPKHKEVLIKVSACGVCHTELDEIEGRIMPAKFPMVLGHEVVGKIEALGKAVTKFKKGDRIGVGRIHQSTGGED